MVEKEESVYPMIPVGAALHEMIRRPGKDPLLETPERQVARQLSVVSGQFSVAGGVQARQQNR
jgi:hypothetical protein